MKYEDRVVVFLDILGFKNLLDSTVSKEGSDNEVAIEKLVDVYDLIHDNWDLPFKPTNPQYPKLSLAKENAEKGKVVTIFSDSIVISFPHSAQGEIFWTLLEIRHLLLEMANRGILSRGGVAFGKLIHSDKIVFGPALVEAYMLECKKAVFPRVLVAQSVLDLAAQPLARMHDAEEELEYIHTLLRKDWDNYYYIDFLEGIQNELDEPEFGYCDYLLNIKGHVQKGLTNHDPGIKNKFEWLKSKLNIAIENTKRPEVIQNLKDQNRDDMIDYYSQLSTL